MSTSMRGTSADRGSPADSREAQEPDEGRDPRPGDAGEKAGVFEEHRWLIPVTVIASIVAAFLAMVLLTWAAGGGTPFGG